MAITFGDHLIDSGYYDITPEQERHIDVIDECKRRGVDPYEICPECHMAAWQVVEREFSIPVCPHDCYRPGDCDGSCTHPEPTAQATGG